MNGSAKRRKARDDDLNLDLVPGTHLAALALEHGLTVYSTDGDFARFPGLNWENPLALRSESDN